ncbi:hypothetical protein NW761_013156 [Fusarium oxysporum]|uniref:Secreted protein n=1 Tax=Fusarium oxysporum f. sp. raphani TaxID=96318 RepID=A0A8J5PWM1_FUSOX|nr:hypothetical protein Forpi1262_v012786 [Fusarium oxysporum f. sp. raphani]KAJ4031088.1 hypothetical protein NW758_012441 [Fusarium oxysporum]KAJ4075331.1 hypothetical protein NW761_013156 [Fusarium oxysporum]KAJ4088286.1 hypothetical protein NW769_013505 [Fusarium oxysporum]KAJ4217841.1 hypothetical protein NW760_013212 [Fusarium oxysporum]
MRLQFLFFLPAVLAWWNCELPIGTGDNGRCIDGTTGNWDACSAVCVPTSSFLLSTANIHCASRVTLAESKEMGAALKAAELRTVLKRLRWHWVTC